MNLKMAFLIYSNMVCRLNLTQNGLISLYLWLLSNSKLSTSTNYKNIRIDSRFDILGVINSKLLKPLDVDGLTLATAIRGLQGGLTQHIIY